MGLDQDVSEWELVGLIEKYLGSVDRVVLFEFCARAAAGEGGDVAWVKAPLRR